MPCAEEVNLDGFRDSIPATALPGRRRKVRIQGQVTQVNVGFASEISEYETEEEDNGETVNVGIEAIRHAYRDETWSHKFFTYSPKPRKFIGRRGTM
jgi:hypothetical protein